MTDIPKDVMKAAREALAGLLAPEPASRVLAGECDWVATIRAAASAILADRKRRVVVKELEWKDGKFSDHPRETATSAFGEYEALQWAQGDFGVTVPHEDKDRSNREYSGAESMEEAKAAAQADYERRILATLEFTYEPDRLAAAEADAERLAEALRSVMTTAAQLGATDMEVDDGCQALAAHEARKGERHE